MSKDTNIKVDEALLFAVTPEGKCVGIRIFPQNAAKIKEEKGNVNNNHNNNNNYVEERLKNAINLKSKIECGLIGSKSSSEIIDDFPASWSGTINNIILSQRQWIRKCDDLKVERHLIDLNAALEHAIQPDKHNFRIGLVILSEINDLIIRNKVTPLMLKKNLTIVENMEKLTRLSKPALNTVQKNGHNSTAYSIFRHFSSITMKRLKRLMNFIGNDKQFLKRMEEWSELLNQLTKHMTDEEKRNLTIDPVLSMPSPLPKE